MKRGQGTWRTYSLDSFPLKAGLGILAALREASQLPSDSPPHRALLLSLSSVQERLLPLTSSDVVGK